jgi:uncharacterized protein (UPF0333 family)
MVKKRGIFTVRGQYTLEYSFLISAIAIALVTLGGYGYTCVVNKSKHIQAEAKAMPGIGVVSYR